MKKQEDEDSTDTTCCVIDVDPWTAKQHHWPFENVNVRMTNASRMPIYSLGSTKALVS